MRAKPRGRVNKICEHCGAEYTRPFSQNERSKWCSQQCKIAALGLRKRGRAKATTYHKRGQLHEHKQVAAAKIGRPLLPNEVVHHIDGDRHNNAPDNLEVLTRAEHTRRHWQQGDHENVMAPRVARIVKQCEVCGESFTVTPARAVQRFCSHACRNTALGDLRRRSH